MSGPAQRRIEVLEARQSQARAWVWRRQGETVDEAKRRAGFTPADAVVVFTWASSKPSTEGAA